MLWIAYFKAVLLFWKHAVIEAFWDSWAFVGQTKEGIMFSCLVALVLIGFLVLKHRKEGIWKKFWEKMGEGIAIALGAFLLVFVWKILAEPLREQTQSETLMSVSQEKQRAAVLARRSAELQRDEIAKIKSQEKIIHGACKATEEQINPLRMRQSCPAGAQPTFRDRVLAINARLTESDRNRFTDALAEYEKLLTDSRNLYGEIDAEGIPLNRSEGELPQTIFEARSKRLNELETRGQGYQRALTDSRSKWQQLFNDQTQYVFGDNPDNRGPMALLNAISVAQGYLGASRYVSTEQDIGPLAANRYFHGIASAQFQERLKIFIDWNKECFVRLAEMRSSIR